MRKLIIALLMLITTIAAGSPLSDATLNVAKKDVGIVEITNRNDHPRIREYQDNVGIGHADPYCAAGTFTWHKEGATKIGIKNPLVRTGAAREIWWAALKNPIRYEVIKATDIRMGYKKLKPGDIIIWKAEAIPESKPFKGHAGVNEYQISNVVIATIEPNTMPSNTGDQRGEGNTIGPKGGVYRKQRPVSKNVKFEILGAVRIRDGYNGNK